MRAMNIFLIFITIFLSSCTSIEVAKEVTKASKSIKKTVENIFEKEDPVDENVTLEVDIKKISNEREEEKKVASIQKKITKIEFIGKTLSEIENKLGNPSLIREDGNTKSVRFDSNNCRLFVYFNNKSKKQKIEYYEIRDVKGKLIDQEVNLNKCFTGFKLV